jgi:hypothetical protein
LNELKFHFEWEDPAGARGSELRATWASLRITVGNDVVTELFDRFTRSEKEHLYLPLYPLAEWIAEHWWHLTKEPLTPGRSTSGTYNSRHSLLSSCEGFAMPSLLIQPHGETALLTWCAFRYQNSPIRFLSSGEGFAELSQVEHELRGLVESVIQRLEDEGVKGTRLQEEWTAVNSVDAEQAEFCVSVAALGLDPFSVAQEIATTIEGVGDRLPADLYGEFFSAAEPRALASEIYQLSQDMDHAQTTSISELLVRARQELIQDRFADSAAWVRGYNAARTVRTLLPHDAFQDPHLESLAQLFGITLALPNQLPPHRSDWVEALAQVSGRASLTYFLPRVNGRKARFTLCRLLYEYLTAGENTWRMITHSRTDIQARNRAFAAEFLVPSDILGTKLSSSVLDHEEVEDLAFEFGVSSWVVRHQLENHQLAQVIG